jgi:hypothetical protein
MKDIEIPYERSRRYRFFEILPGALSWSVLFLPLVLSLINVSVAAAFIFLYILIYLVRAFAISIRALQGYHRMREHQKLDWQQLVAEVETGAVDSAVAIRRPKWHLHNLARLGQNGSVVKPSEVLHAVIIATVKESREVLEPTIQSLINSDFDTKKVILVLAYEERGGEEVAARARDLMDTYRGHFYEALPIQHPKNIPGELIGKGGNVSYAGRELAKYLEAKDIDPIRVVVTTLDADNRPDKKYLAALTYLYSVCPDPERVSFQPITVFTNNIWDAPAPMRVVAVGNSFFHIAHSQRVHMLRNFSAHAQGMKPLINMNFWSVRTVVEDGHHFWRSYMKYEGNYRVLPLYVPINQDAVLTDGYIKTLKAQFIQYRRWTWGASDIAYVAEKGFFTKNKIPLHDLVPKFWRLLEGHVNWAVGPIICLGAGFLPGLLQPQSYAANTLPLLLSNIQTVALVGVLATLFICFKTLPPKPARYKRHRTLFMVLQWIYMPVTGIVYNSFAALYSQTRLMLGKYLDKFDVTEKAVVMADNKIKS